MTGRRVAVVGAGIAGLAAAWDLRGRAEVCVFEPGPPGGKIRTSSFAGRPVDEGPDAFLTRVPGAVGLAEELGLGAELVAPTAGVALIWSDGRLHPLPERLVLGVPTSVGPLLRSRLLSPLGLARAALDVVLPSTPPGRDESVYDLVRRRFGEQVARRLVEPLLGSIHAAPVSELSTATTAPNLLAAARSSRSLLLGLRRQAAPGAAPAPTAAFLTHPDGLGRMVEELAWRLERGGVRFTTAKVGAVEAADDGIRVDGEPFDGGVLAVPAAEAARLLGPSAPAGLAAIPTTDVVIATFDVATADLAVPPDVNGILVRPGAGHLMTACSFGTNKWPQWRTAEDRAVVRISAGRHGDRRAFELDDGALTDRLAADLSAMLGRDVIPAAARISRWPDAFPLYRVGHLDLVAGIESDLAQVSPRLTLAGSSYLGAGIPACITSGRTAARTLLAAVTAP